MVYLPNEVVNIIFSYVERPRHAKLIKYLIEDCYEEDYNIYTAEKWSDNYCFEYSFIEWYYLYRLMLKLGGLQMKRKIKKDNYKYKHTHKILLIGCDKLGFI